MSDVAPFVCFDCQTAFKRPGKFPGFIRVCPHCGHTAYQMGVKFCPPKKSNQAQWDIVTYLAKHGFYYQEIHNLHGCIWETVRYPDTLAEAQEFVKHFCDQAIRTLAEHSSEIETPSNSEALRSRSDL